jgi:hypothetical protein
MDRLRTLYAEAVAHAESAPAPLPTSPHADQQPPRTIHATQDHLIASWLHFVFVVWRRETTLDGVLRMSASLDDLARNVGHEVGAFIIAEEAARAPPPAVRNPIATVMRTAPVAFCAVVLEGAGFRAATLRAFATGVGLLARPRYPYRPFATVIDAAKWLESRTPENVPTVRADAIAGVVHRVRG